LTVAATAAGFTPERTDSVRSAVQAATTQAPDLLAQLGSSAGPVPSLNPKQRKAELPQMPETAGAG